MPEYIVTIPVQVIIEKETSDEAIAAALEIVNAGDGFDAIEEQAHAAQNEWHTTTRLYDGTLKRPDPKHGGVVVFVSGPVDPVRSWAEITRATKTRYRRVEGNALRASIGSEVGGDSWLEARERARLIKRFGRVIA
jgi:hypothetical protein